MKNRTDSAIGMLCLIYVLISSDGEISPEELNYLSRIKETEGISERLFGLFESSISGKTGREIYQIGIESILRCSMEEKLLAFVRLYQMAHADGIIHVREIRFLLYAVKLADVDLDVIMRASKTMELS
jgi:hypothetical protein